MFVRMAVLALAMLMMGQTAWAKPRYAVKRRGGYVATSRQYQSNYNPYTGKTGAFYRP